MKVRPALLLARVAVVLVFLAAMGGTAHARRRGSAGGGRSAHAIAEGRTHLRKANALAGQDKWWSAIKEYTLAFEKLGDPVVLFNRADCYRRVGENERAVADYRAFLKGFPGAPNRAEIEARIASLEAPGAKDAAAAEAPAKEPPPKKEPPKKELAKKELPKTEEPAEAAARAGAHPVTAAAPTTEVVPVPDLAVAPEPPAPTAAALVAPPDEPVVIARPEKPKKRGYWWVWVLAGVAVAGGGAAAFIALRPHPANIPPTDLGNYHF